MFSYQTDFVVTPVEEATYKPQVVIFVTVLSVSSFRLQEFSVVGRTPAHSLTCQGVVTRQTTLGVVLVLNSSLFKSCSRKAKKIQCSATDKQV